MTKMIGRMTKLKQCPYRCCWVPISRKTIKRREARQWKKEYNVR